MRLRELAGGVSGKAAVGAPEAPRRTPGATTVSMESGVNKVTSSAPSELRPVQDSESEHDSQVSVLAVLAPLSASPAVCGKSPCAESLGGAGLGGKRVGADHPGETAFALSKSTLTCGMACWTACGVCPCGVCKASTSVDEPGGSGTGRDVRPVAASVIQDAMLSLSRNSATSFVVLPTEDWTDMHESSPCLHLEAPCG